MELLNWFKKSYKWWLGLIFIVAGTLFMRQVGQIAYAQEIGGAMVFLGLAMVLIFGMTKSDPNE